MTTQQEQLINRIRKTAPSREAAEDVRRIALSLPDGSDDQALLLRVADFLLDARQALRGGRRDVAGGRHWPHEEWLDTEPILSHTENKTRQRRETMTDNRCPSSEKAEAWPGTYDQCPSCGKMVRARKDGTLPAHQKPKGT